MSKKIIITTTVVLTLFLVCLLGYFFLTKNSQSDTKTPSTGFKNFFPFGDGSSSSSNNTPQSTTTNQANNQGYEPQAQDYALKLRKISTEPVSGAGTVDVKAGTLVRYIEKATGHIFEVELFSPKVSRISNTTIPLSNDAMWGNKSNSLVARYLKDDNETVDTYLLNLKISTSSEETISGIILPSNIDNMTVFGTNVFYLIRGSNSSTGFISDFNGKNVKQIWSSDIKELNSQFVNDRIVALTTKPAVDVSGFLYFIDTKNGSAKRIIGNIAGLSTITNPDASRVAYLEEGDATLFKYIDLKSRNSYNLNPNTFPEKCVWGKKTITTLFCGVPKDEIDSSSLTRWYKGLDSYEDAIWLYDTKTNASIMIEDLSNDSGEKIDVSDPIITDNDQYLIFTNKKDNSLWSLDLTKVSTTTVNIGD